MKKIGIILNPSARINSRKTAGVLKSLGETFGGKAVLRTTKNEGELPGAVKALRKEKIDILLISGGDGTICNVLTEYVNQHGEDGLPMVAPLMGGTINMIGSDAGLRNSQLSIARKINDFIEKGKPLPFTERSLVRVTDAGRESPAYGFTWIDGLLYNFLLEYYSQGAGIQVASVMTMKMLVALISNADSSTFKNIDSVVYMDGVKLPHEGHVLLIASGLRKLVFGFDIWDEKSKPGVTFNAVYIREEYLRKNRHILPLGLYRSLKSDPAGNFVNRALSSLKVERNMGYIIDGEIFKHEEPVDVTMEPGPGIRIISFHGEKKLPPENRIEIPYGKIE